MATVLESLTVPPPTFPNPTTTPLATFALPFHRRSFRLPHVKGLKLTFNSSTINRSLGSFVTLSSSRHASGGRIVCEAQEAAVEVAAVTDATWKSVVLESESPVLVEFWAPWCGPCRMIHPVIDELAKQYAGKLKCYKVNTDDCSSIASQYGVRSIPTVIIFKNGEKKEAIIGAVPKTTLTTSIDKFLLFSWDLVYNDHVKLVPCCSEVNENGGTIDPSAGTRFSGCRWREQKDWKGGYLQNGCWPSTSELSFL